MEKEIKIKVVHLILIFLGCVAGHLLAMKLGII